MTREQMMDKVVRRYGFEVEETLAFCRMCENDSFSDDEVKAIYNSLMR